MEYTGALITRSVNSRAGLTQVFSVEHKSQDTTQCRNSWKSGNKGSFSVFRDWPLPRMLFPIAPKQEPQEIPLDGGSSSPKWISCLIWSHLLGEPKECCRWELRLITSASYHLCSSESPAPLCSNLGWVNNGAELPTYPPSGSLGYTSPGPLACTPDSQMMWAYTGFV